MDNLYQKLNKN